MVTENEYNGVKYVEMATRDCKIKNEYTYGSGFKAFRIMELGSS